jgi:hypothetical protein
LSDQLLQETMQKDEQLNRLREANLELRSHIFSLNQDILDLMEIVEIQKNRRSVSHANGNSQLTATNKFLH